MVNLYLRRHGTDSMPKKRRQRQCLLTLLILFCSMSPWQGAKASYAGTCCDCGTQCWQKCYDSYSWDAEKGCIRYVVRYWQNWGSGHGGDWCGWREDEGGATITQYTTTNKTFKISCQEKAKSDGTHIVTKPTSNCELKWDKGNTCTEYFAQWYEPVSTDDLNKEITINIEGKWWRYGTTWDDQTDCKVDANNSVYTKASVGSYEVGEPSYSIVKGTPVIKVPWKWNKSGCNVEKANECGLWYNGRLQQDLQNLHKGDLVTESSKGDTLYFVADNDFLKKTHRFILHRKYNPTGNNNIHYEANSDEVAIKAFAQVDNMSVEGDENKKLIHVAFEVPTVSGETYDDSPFSVRLEKLQTNGTYELIKDSIVQYSSGTKQYTLDFNIGVVDSSTYKVSAARQKTYDIKGWDRYIFSKVVTICTDHCYPQNMKVKKSTTKDGENCIEISWDQTGSIWTNGTDMVIHRTNLTTTSTSNFNVKKEQFHQGMYQDALIQQCNNYVYEIEFKPGSSNYAPKTLNVDEKLSFVNIGSLESLEVSKGYYSDKVDLSWRSNGDFDEFVVERRENDNPNSKYTKILSIGGLNISDYAVEDRSCQPGVMYAYRVYGLKKCMEDVYNSRDTLYGYGFRTPTGNFYGRIAFENGQAESDVEVRMESDENFRTYALKFYGADTAKTTTTTPLSSGYPLTMQLWVKPEVSSDEPMTLIDKADYFKLQLVDGSVRLKVGDTSVVTDKKILNDYYTHVSAVVDDDSTIHIYLNGDTALEAKGLKLKNAIKNSDVVVIGENFKGEIDDVRLWSRALGRVEVKKDYTRYLVGDEDALDAYYTFDFMSENEFYDISHKGSVYNGNTGVLMGAKKVYCTLNVDQLGYRGYTNEDGQFAINAVPYYGNGTSYTIIPRKGTHQFMPKQEVRFVSGDAQSHTINFTDNSSFPLTGFVYYSGGTYPVEGVSFTIDGVPALDKSGQYVMTSEIGKFTINVPVGIHEVRAVKPGHTFEMEGRVCNVDGSDRNYQDEDVATLYDNTKVKYIGRVCGGEVQEGYPVGFSLSKNNLADDMKVILSATQSVYDLQSNAHSDTINHPVLKHISGKEGKMSTGKTVCDYNRDNITIHVDNETGEFIAWVYPIEYKVGLSVYGHKDIAGDNSALDLSKYVPSQYETYTYVDTIVNGTETRYPQYTDTIDYRQKQVFTKRYRAKMVVSQSSNDMDLEFFGDRSYTYVSATGDQYPTSLYVDSTKTYTFGLPVFIMNKDYQFHYSIFEEYPYYIDNNMHVDENRIDRVMISGAEVSFNNKFAYSEKIDTVKQLYSFKVNEPDMTTAKGTVSATFTYGDSDNPTSVSWDNPMGNPNGEAYVFGSHQTGTDFITGGPDKLLCVLRDPPGSNSYSYLEKGTSFTQSSTYSGSFNHEGSEMWTTGYKLEAMTINTANTPASSTGTINTLFETNSGIKAGIVQEAEYTGSNSKSNNITLTTRIQTSDDPMYVGADADLYVGYSTNISFGSTQNVTSIPIALYDSMGGAQYFETLYAKADSYAIVKTKGISSLENFATMFAYPQIYIEQTLLPNLKDLKSSLILPMSEAKDDSIMQALAESKKENIYVSKVSLSDPSFGEEGSYKTYFFDNRHCDTIHYINQSIKRWEDVMSDNDQIKIETKNKGEVLQNYSFQAGANIEYGESYSSALSSSHSFSIKLGVEVSDDNKATTAGTYVLFEFDETFTTTQGGEFSSEAEASHSKGFVLAEDGDDDYLSVDVYREMLVDEVSVIYDPDSVDFDESYVNWVNAGTADTTKLTKKDYYPTFVFVTRGGATSCPYEGAYAAKHWKGHKTEVINVATMKLEEPSIDMPKKFIENVPSGEDAYLTVYMKNNSETGEDQWFDLRLVDASNPNGAIPSIDGNSMSGFALEYLVPAGQVLEKTLAITKGSVLNYDNLALALCSKCQADPTGFLDVIADTVYFSVHFIPSCSDVAIVKPSNNWTYNTNCAVDTIDGVAKHYMPITISDFDVNYTDFDHIELQYKPASGSDNDWVTLGYYYKDSTLANSAVANGFNAFTISSEDAGNIYYNFFMDNLPDQNYDLRAVSFCNINNELYENPSEVVSGIKDMYNPRLFGSPRPANGVLTIDDDIRIDFNETIAEGMLTVNSFEITGVRNGVVSDHSVAIALDGENDYLTTEVTRNFANKDLTFECWVNYDSLQNATFFSHGDATESISMGMNKEGKIVVKVGNKVLVSESVPAWEKSSWNHVALVYNNENKTVTAYVNYMPVINSVNVEAYKGDGVIEVGRNVASANGYFNGKVDQFRIWNSVRSSATIQANCTSQLSGNDLNLMAYYEMEEAKGAATEDKARGANLLMKGGSWALPEGRSAEFNGQSYVAMNSSSAVITSDMDFTLEFWFNAESEAKGQTLISNGTGLASDAEDATKLFSVGFDPTGALTFRHNGYVTPLEGDFSDNNWHNFTLAVSRSSGVARIYVDGELNTYFSADKIGGIASDKLFAGACVYYVANDSTTVAKQRKADQYFSGRIDEVRLWNLYRQQSQVENFYNQKSNGDEMGLQLYYPFEHYVEWQGTSQMQFTLEDKGNDALDGNGKKLAFATMQGVVSESRNIPPVKTKGATSSLLFDWVVNDDALIINLQEQDYRVEKTIVNFTVKGVQDLNGNYIVSPITWSAYIDRNQLKWMDDAVTVNKKQNEPYKFEMPIVNKGGSVINYSLKNMPAWLSASSESGAINPLEKQTIEFEIDPSLAVGTYDEVVYLTNSNNVTEPLALNVTVEGDTPDWSVDPSKYEFSMAVFAQIKLDNQFSNDERDMLAAFYKGKCVGVANMSYDKTMDLWYAMLTVYCDTTKYNGLVYRAWDASKGIMSEAVSSPVVSFEADTVYGKPTAPVVFYNGTTKYQNIPLSKGWNWVSFNLENKAGMADLNTYLNSGKWGLNSIVKDLSGHSANYSAVSGKWLNDSLVLNNTNMFKIYSDENQVLSVAGSGINLDSMMIPVKAGSWNYIAYLPTGSMTLKTALAGYEAKDGDVIKSNEGFAMYYGNEWIGSLNSLQPNCGYMLKNTGNVQKTFKYPSSSSALRSAVSVESSAYESNMSIIASAPEKREGDLLRTLVGTEENKIVEVALSDDYALQFINVSAKAGDKVRFTMERDGVTYEANNALTFTGDAIYGTPDHPFVLNFNVGGVETLTVYPNPMDVELNVAGKLDGEGDVTLELFDVLGVLVFEKQVSASDNVLDESINVSGLVPGSYMLKVSQGDESKVFKVVKK